MKATLKTVDNSDDSDIDDSHFSMIPKISPILSRIPLTMKTRMPKTTMMMMIWNWNRDLKSSMGKDEIRKKNLDATT